MSRSFVSFMQKCILPTVVAREKHGWLSGVVLAALTGPQARSYSQAMWLPGGSTSLPDIALSDTASIS